MSRRRRPAVRMPRKVAATLRAATASFGPYPGTVLSLHDGDTFRVEISIPRARHTRDVGWDLTLPSSSALGWQARIVVDVRLYGCNAAEIATPAGKADLAYLQTLIPVGTIVALTSYGWDKYGGRTDAAITLVGGANDGKDLTALMVAAGHAAPWDGTGPKPVPPA